MEPGFAIGLGVLWVLLNLLGRKKGPPDISKRPPVTLPPVTGTDATQQEGVRLQDVLRELGRTIENAANTQRQPQVKRPPSTKRLQPVRHSDEGRSLETESEVRSLETDIRRSQRAVVDSDDEAEAIIARRIAAAEANARPLGAASHKSFDARIRQEPADATATQAPSMQRLRQAVIWREIIGPPAAFRDTDLQ